MRRFTTRIADLLFGPYCADGCGHRVYPKDRTSHAEDCWKVAR